MPDSAHAARTISPSTARRLAINNIHAEPDVPADHSTAAAIRRAIEELALFLGAQDIAYPARIPAG